MTATTTRATSVLTVPKLPPNCDTLTAALAYAEAGFYMLPVKRGSKHPGSIVGKNWQAKSSRDPHQLAAWFAGTGYDLAVHVGRSGAVVLDVDTPERLPAVLVDAIAASEPPYQSTRVDVPGRGHYMFAMPADRTFGNGVGQLAGGWGEVRGHNGIVIVAPSTHELAAEGGRYQWQSTGPLPVLPDTVAALLVESGDEIDAATTIEVERFLDVHTDATRPDLLNMWVSIFQRKVTEGESRHGRMVSVAAGAMQEARAGYFNARVAAEALQAAFLAAVAQAPRGKQGNARTGSPARAEWDGILAWAVAVALAADLHAVRRRTNEKAPDVAAWLADIDGDPLDGDPLGALLAHVRGWHQLGDMSHVLFALAVAVSAHDEGEPLWGMIVGAPSSGKTETARMLDASADDRLDELTAAGLLSWSRHKPPRPVGILTRVGSQAFVTVGDFSTVLAMSDRGARDMLFALLRRVYDGSVTRDLGNASVPLRWEGRLTILTAVTPVIDNYSAHADALGPRWLYLRMPEQDTATRRRAASRDSRDALAGNRAHARALAAQIVTDGRKRLTEVTLDTATREALADVAVVVCGGRGAVPREGYGRRDISGLPVVEEPHRLVAQLHALTRGALAIGVEPADAVRLARRAALDTVPRARLAVLEVLSDGEALTVAQTAERAGMHRQVARMALEELREVRLTCCPIEDDADVDDVRQLGNVRRDWQLTTDLGDLARDVLIEQRHDRRAS